MEIMNDGSLSQGVDDGVQEEQAYGNDDNYIHKVIFADLFDEKLSDFTYVETVFIFIRNQRIKI